MPLPTSKQLKEMLEPLNKQIISAELTCSIKQGNFTYTFFVNSNIPYLKKDNNSKYQNNDETSVINKIPFNKEKEIKKIALSNEALFILTTEGNVYCHEYNESGSGWQEIFNSKQDFKITDIVCSSQSQGDIWLTVENKNTLYRCRKNFYVWDIKAFDTYDYLPIQLKKTDGHIFVHTKVDNETILICESEQSTGLQLIEKHQNTHKLFYIHQKYYQELLTLLFEQFKQTKEYSNKELEKIPELFLNYCVTKANTLDNRFNKQLASLNENTIAWQWFLAINTLACLASDNCNKTEDKLNMKLFDFCLSYLSNVFTKITIEDFKKNFILLRQVCQDAPELFAVAALFMMHHKEETTAPWLIHKLRKVEPTGSLIKNIQQKLYSMLNKKEFIDKQLVANLFVTETLKESTGNTLLLNTIPRVIWQKIYSHLDIHYRFIILSILSGRKETTAYRGIVNTFNNQKFISEFPTNKTTLDGLYAIPEYFIPGGGAWLVFVTDKGDHQHYLLRGQEKIFNNRRTIAEVKRGSFYFNNDTIKLKSDTKISVDFFNLSEHMRNGDSSYEIVCDDWLKFLKSKNTRFGKNSVLNHLSTDQNGVEFVFKLCEKHKNVREYLALHPEMYLCTSPDNNAASILWSVCKFSAGLKTLNLLGKTNDHFFKVMAENAKQYLFQDNNSAFHRLIERYGFWNTEESDNADRFLLSLNQQNANLSKVATAEILSFCDTNKNPPDVIKYFFKNILKNADGFILALCKNSNYFLTEFSNFLNTFIDYNCFREIASCQPNSLLYLFEISKNDEFIEKIVTYSVECSQIYYTRTSSEFCQKIIKNKKSITIIQNKALSLEEQNLSNLENLLVSLENIDENACGKVIEARIENILQKQINSDALFKIRNKKVNKLIDDCIATQVKQTTTTLDQLKILLPSRRDREEIIDRALEERISSLQEKYIETLLYLCGYNTRKLQSAVEKRIIAIFTSLLDVEQKEPMQTLIDIYNGLKNKAILSAITAKIKDATIPFEHVFLLYKEQKDNSDKIRIINALLDSSSVTDKQKETLANEALNQILAGELSLKDAFAQFNSEKIQSFFIEVIIQKIANKDTTTEEIKKLCTTTSCANDKIVDAIIKKILDDKQSFSAALLKTDHGGAELNSYQSLIKENKALLFTIVTMLLNKPDSATTKDLLHNISDLQLKRKNDFINSCITAISDWIITEGINQYLADKCDITFLRTAIDKITLFDDDKQITKKISIPFSKLIKEKINAVTNEDTLKEAQTLITKLSALNKTITQQCLLSYSDNKILERNHYYFVEQGYDSVLAILLKLNISPEILTLNIENKLEGLYKLDWETEHKLKSLSEVEAHRDLIAEAILNKGTSTAPDDYEKMKTLAKCYIAIHADTKDFSKTISAICTQIIAATSDDSTNDEKVAAATSIHQVFTAVKKYQQSPIIGKLFNENKIKQPQTPKETLTTTVIASIKTNITRNEKILRNSQLKLAGYKILQMLYTLVTVGHGGKLSGYRMYKNLVEQTKENIGTFKKAEESANTLAV